MKIILLKDVPRIGNKGTIHDFASIYAMNAFVNKGIARIATAQDEKLAKEKEEKRKSEKENISDKYRSTFLNLEKDSKENPIIIKKKVDDKGHFYAKFSKHELVDTLFSLLKISINENQIITDIHSVTTLGDHEVELSINNKKYIVRVNIVKA